MNIELSSKSIRTLLVAGGLIAINVIILILLVKEPPLGMIFLAAEALAAIVTGVELRDS